MTLLLLTTAQRDGIETALQRLARQGWLSEPRWERWDTYIGVSYRWEWPGHRAMVRQHLVPWLPPGTPIEIGTQ